MSDGVQEALAFFGKTVPPLAPQRRVTFLPVLPPCELVSSYQPPVSAASSSSFLS